MINTYNVEDVITAITAKIKCGSTNCTDCERFFDCQGCPADKVDNMDMVDFIEKVYMKMKAPFGDPWNELSEDEVVRIIAEEV